MDDAKPANIALRNDTVLGVCEAIGQDFGVRPLWLRLLFAGSIYWAPVLVIGTYFGLGLIVLASRIIYPDLPTFAAVPTEELETGAETTETTELPLAA